MRPPSFHSLLKGLTGSATWLHNRLTRSSTNLQELFQLFKGVLASNNQALELITDMGQKLDGSYIFDIVYIRRAYTELARHIRTSLEKFNQLTRNRYEITPVFERIDGLITAMIQGGGSGEGDAILFLDEVPWFRAREVGGKNYHLAELRKNLGLNTPDTFVFTTRAYTQFLEHNDLAGILSRTPEEKDEQPTPEAIQAAILGGVFPPELEERLDLILKKLTARYGTGAALAVRSSAEEEDDFFSFAGQFETVLNVPLRKDAVLAACKKVYASLFSSTALAYQERFGYTVGSLKMSVGCVLQLNPVASGVIYTANPVSGDTEDIIINASWGLGTSVVDGTTDADHSLVRRTPEPHLVETRTGAKELMTVLDPDRGEGIREIATPADKRARNCLSNEELLRLAADAIEIEKYFKLPQDIEWAMIENGTIFFLQSRPLKVAEPADRGSERETEAGQPPTLPALSFKKSGLVVQKGVAAGKAYVLHKVSELSTFPRGAILVAHSDSPQFIRIMPYAAAIITDTGSFTSHMASVCREFGLPTIVNTGNATQIIRHGQEITLDADDSGQAMVVNGIAEDLLDQQRRTRKMDELYEYRRQKYILRYISPLNLVNSLAEEFKPEKCRTIHDVLRFMHEKSVQELLNISNRGFSRPAMLRLDLSVPAGIHVLDIGGGLPPGAKSPITIDDITSVPFQAILKGMTWEGAWNTEAVALGVKDFFGSVSRISVTTPGASGFGENNIAVISKEYVHLNMGLGYHFNLVDSYCSERAANNHIYFRFVGGATDIVKRSRRISLIEQILSEFGFISKIKGDLIVSRLSHVAREEIIDDLVMLGRLIAYTRQMDAVLHDESQVALYARKFLDGDFQI